MFSRAELRGGGVFVSFIDFLVRNELIQRSDCRWYLILKLVRFPVPITVFSLRVSRHSRKIAIDIRHCQRNFTSIGGLKDIPFHVALRNIRISRRCS